MQVITDARRKRQVELNKQEHRKEKSKSLRTDSETQGPQPQVVGSSSDPEETPEVAPGGSGIVNVDVLTKELLGRIKLIGLNCCWIIMREIRKY